MIICVGEILADMTGRTCHGHMEFTCFAGGALAVSQKGAYPEWSKEDAAALMKELDA